MTEPEHVIGGPGGVGIMFLDVQSGPVLMIEQAIENMRRFAGGRADHLGVEWVVLIGDEGVQNGAEYIPYLALTSPRSGATACSENSVRRKTKWFRLPRGPPSGACDAR